MGLLRRMRDRFANRAERRRAAELRRMSKTLSGGVVSPVDRQQTQTWGV